MTLSSDGEALTGLWFDGQLHFGRTLAPQYGSCVLPVFERAAAWLDCYFGGGRPDFEVPLRWRDTPFREVAIYTIKNKSPKFSPTSCSLSPVKSAKLRYSMAM